MNNKSTLDPLGSLLEQKNKGRTRVKIAVFFVLAVHGVGLLALLLQGCHKEEATAQATTQPANSPPDFQATTNLQAQGPEQTPQSSTPPVPAPTTASTDLPTPPPAVA